MENVDSVGQRSDCTFVQSDLDLHCLQKLLVSSSVGNEWLRCTTPKKEDIT